MAFCCGSSHLQKMCFMQRVMDEETDLEEHKSRVAFVVIILGDGSFGGK